MAGKESFAEALGAREEAPGPRRPAGRERKEAAASAVRRNAGRTTRSPREPADDDAEEASEPGGTEAQPLDARTEGKGAGGEGAGGEAERGENRSSPAFPVLGTDAMLALFGHDVTLAPAPPVRLSFTSAAPNTSPEVALATVRAVPASRPPELCLDAILAEAGASIRVEELPAAMAAIAPPPPVDEDEWKPAPLDAPTPRLGALPVETEAVLENPTILPPEAAVEIAEHAPLPHAIAVHVRDADGDWRLDLSRHADSIDLVVHGGADVRHILRDAERDLRTSFQDMGQTMGTLDFKQRDARDSQARPEEAPPWPVGRRPKARASVSESSARPTGVLDRRV